MGYVPMQPMSLGLSRGKAVLSLFAAIKLRLKTLSLARLIASLPMPAGFRLFSLCLVMTCMEAAISGFFWAIVVHKCKQVGYSA